MTKIEKTYEHKEVPISALKFIDNYKAMGVLVDLVTLTLPDYILIETAVYEAGLHVDTLYKLKKKGKK